MTARCEELIIVMERRGRGVESDPVRAVTGIFTKKGERIAEDDSEGCRQREQRIAALEAEAKDLQDKLAVALKEAARSRWLEAQLAMLRECLDRHGRFVGLNRSRARAWRAFEHANPVAEARVPEVRT